MADSRRLRADSRRHCIRAHGMEKQEESQHSQQHRYQPLQQALSAHTCLDSGDAGLSSLASKII